MFNLNRLLHILSINRAHGGPGVDHFYKTVLAGYNPEEFLDNKADTIAWGLPVGESKTLFVAHVDTAETWDGQMTRVNVLDPVTNTLMTDGKHVLGADCGAGVAILLHMIDNNVPGYYLFTQGEEKGGIGAKGVAQCYPEFLGCFDRAVAFDRRGTGSVITHMFRGRTCSDMFAESLSNALDCEAYTVMPDPTGSYTDTAEFTDKIGEATNISVGYQSEHSSKETLDMTYIVHLAAKVLEVDWEALPCVRKAGEADPDDLWNYAPRRAVAVPEVWEDLQGMTVMELAKWVGKADPMEVALMIADMLDVMDYAEVEHCEDKEPVYEADFDLREVL